MAKNPLMRVLQGIRLSSGAESISVIPDYPSPGYTLFGNGIPFAHQFRAFLPGTIAVTTPPSIPIALQNLKAGQTQLQPLVDNNYNRLG